MLKLATCKNCLKVLTDPTRLDIIELLSNSAGMSVNDIVDHFNLRQPTISHHLKELKVAGFVKTKKRGTVVTYTLDKICKRDSNIRCWLLENPPELHQSSAKV